MVKNEVDILSRVMSGHPLACIHICGLVDKRVVTAAMVICTQPDISKFTSSGVRIREQTPLSVIRTQCSTNKLQRD
jgi:hypothetical protein